MLAFIEILHNRLINECSRKKLAKIPEFFVRYKRSYVLNNSEGNGFDFEV